MRGGLLSPFAEANPNLYKAHTIFAPYCSSDAWLGGGSGAEAARDSTTPSKSHFQGFAALNATLQHALRGNVPGGDSLGQASNIVLTGGPGAILSLSLLLPQLRADLPAAARIHLVCDGCTWGAAVPPSDHTALRAQGRAPGLLPMLKEAWPLWTPPAPLSPATSVGSAFNRQLLRLADPTNGIVASLTWLAPQASAAFLASLGVHVGGAGAADNTTIQNAVRALRLSAHAFAAEASQAGVVPRVFSPNCAWPAELAASDEVFHVGVQQAGPMGARVSAAALVVDAVSGKSESSVLIDALCETGHAGACNPSCPAVSAEGGEAWPAS